MFDYPDISKDTLEKGKKAEKDLKDIFDLYGDISEANQYKVLNAFRTNKVCEADFNTSTGYGYNDTGRDRLERVYADIFHAEDALVRPQITCGTHAIYLSMQANLLPKDEILFISGKPYDSLASSIGISDDNEMPHPCSLKENGVSYKIIDLVDKKIFDKDAILNAISDKTKMIHIQRSKGYDIRDSLSVEQIGSIIKDIKNKKSDVIINVDNCYGEFTDIIEPTDVGADLCVGSLIKNPGGGLAVSGGYITGKKEFVERCAYKLTAPGLGKEVGSSYGLLRAMYQGLSLAPAMVFNAVKNAYFSAKIAEIYGYETYPKSNEKRNCIVQAIKLSDPDKLAAFCSAIQSNSYVDSYVTPEGWDMPGYDDQIIMASGSFVSGSSLELSADGPLRDPYVVYFQGGLTHEQGRYAILKAFDDINKLTN